MWAENGVVLTNMRGSQAVDYSRMTINNLKMNILCDRHNKALSGLDDIGKKFAEFIKNGPNQPKDIVINGSDLERWFLKIFLGLSVDFNKQQRGMDNWQPSMKLLNVLFNKYPLEKDGGFYSLLIGNTELRTHSLSINYVSDKQSKEGIGIVVSLEVVTILFSIIPSPPINPDVNAKTFFHPASLQFPENNGNRILHTGWSNGINIVYEKTA